MVRDRRVSVLLFFMYALKHIKMLLDVLMGVERKETVLLRQSRDDFKKCFPLKMSPVLLAEAEAERFSAAFKNIFI